MPNMLNGRDQLEQPVPAQLRGVPGTGFGATDGIANGTATAARSEKQGSPLHQGPDDCLDRGFMGDWDLPGPNTDSYLDLEQPDYANFESWIPTFTRPKNPCNYCWSKRLDCYSRRGKTGCEPCSSLFRECSLDEAGNHYSQATSPVLDTLHSVSEDVARERGTFTGTKLLRSQSKASSRTTPVRPDDGEETSKRNGIRFPQHAIKVLRDWLTAHAAHPYPTEDEKAELEKQTELKPSQITNWLANARRKRKVTSRTRSKLCPSPNLGPSTPAIAIPVSPEKPWDELNPFERWQHSPPEHEPASLTDIAHAIAHTEYHGDSASASGRGSRQVHGSSNGSAPSNARAPSTTSFDTGQSTSRSAASSTVFSQGSSRSHGSFGSFSSSLAGKKDRQLRRRPGATPPSSKRSWDKKQRMFQCTFCTDTFKSKYDWTRHEKSLHLCLEKWICAPLGPVIIDPTNGKNKCVYCDAQDPSEEHCASHKHRLCEEKGLDARTFYRKDHLRQHLRLIHGCEMCPSMDAWSSTANNIKCRCGLCAQRFLDWQERVDHIAAHFKAGARMSEWKGCRGLDPAVAAQVTNAMPPYLIGLESRDIHPFSASNQGSWYDSPPDHTTDSTPAKAQPPITSNEPNPAVSKATCWEILTVRLGKYANDMAVRGLALTDEMLQKQARRILYDSDDDWDHTAADNPEWLDLFKKAHGQNYIPSQIGGSGLNIPEDIETYADLGLRVPFVVQVKAYNDHAARSPGPHQEKMAGKVLSGPFPQRFRLELPPERARRFATVTGAWEDSGMMPDPIHTGVSGSDRAPTTAAAQNVSHGPSRYSTTGAMMEFLGGDVGRPLPCSRDSTTTSIMFPPCDGTVSTAVMPVDWLDPYPLSATLQQEQSFEHHDTGLSMLDNSTTALPAGVTAADEALWMKDLDDLLAINPSDHCVNPHASTAKPSTTSQLMPSSKDMADMSDYAMEDLSFDDMDMTGVFDVPFDDPFGVDASVDGLAGQH